MSEGNKISVLIVDDSKLTVVGLKTTLAQFEELKVIGEVSDGKDALDVVPKLQPDVILMDIGMPVMDGIKATKELKKNKNMTSKIIMLTSHDSEQNVLDALSAGANSYCMKDVEPEVLLNVIKSTYAGASWLDPRIAQIVLDKFVDKFGKFLKSDNMIDLTEREIDVLSLISKGYSNQSISNELCISLNTVKTHIKNIFQKLEVEDRTQAAMKAMKEDLI
ncbi:MAG: response regulator transcription factor [Candidatus Gastranaerophilales bacterium]|jgi:DNA-binding NarL/FixJ family response regulator|nr:response regulator transcription factor [Candidatus Gastranaerophilales bacterium]